MLPKLEGYAAAVISALTDAERRGAVDQLESVDNAVHTQAALNAALSDTAISPEVRSAVLRDLLTGKVTDVVVRLCAYAARVSSGPELSATLADLTHYAVLRSRDEGHTPEMLSLLEARKRVAGYADALLESVPTSEFSNIEDDLFRWARTVEASPELRRVLVDRDAAIDSRVGLTRALLESKVGATSLALAIYAVEGGRPRDIVGTLDFLVDYTARARDWRVARVRTARALSNEDRSSLVSSLRTITGQEVELQVVQDEALLGGVLVEVGDLRLDASTKGRLASLHDAIAGSLNNELLLNRNS